MAVYVCAAHTQEVKSVSTPQWEAGAAWVQGFRPSMVRVPATCRGCKLQGMDSRATMESYSPAKSCS
jgi:hypothetical protein